MTIVCLYWQCIFGWVINVFVSAVVWWLADRLRVLFLAQAGCGQWGVQNHGQGVLCMGGWLQACWKAFQSGQSLQVKFHAKCTIWQNVWTCNHFEPQRNLSKMRIGVRCMPYVELSWKNKMFFIIDLDSYFVSVLQKYLFRVLYFCLPS